MPRSLFFPLVLPVAMAVASTWQKSADADVPLRLLVEGPPSCPSPDAYFAEVRKHADGARLASGSEKAAFFRVTVREAAGVFIGHLEGTGLDAVAVERSIEGNNCEEVAAALAWITAVVVSPKAQHPRAAVSADASLSALSNPKNPVPIPTADAERWSAGIHGVATNLAWNDPSFGASVFGEWASRWRTLISPSLRLSGRWFRNTAAAPDQGTGEFRWLIGRVDACVLRLAIGDAASVSGCAQIEAGSLRAQGEGVATPRSLTKSWAAAGPFVRFQLDVLGGLYAEAQAGLSFPLVKDTFVFDGPLVLVRDSSLAVVDTEVGVGMRF